MDGPAAAATGDALDSAGDTSEAIMVTFPNGDAVSVEVAGTEFTVADLRSKIVEKHPVTGGLRLICDGSLLADTEKAQTLVGMMVSAVVTASDMSYFVETEDKQGLQLLDVGMEGFDEAVGRKAQVKEDLWVPAPEKWPSSQNLARMRNGASIWSSSNMAGSPGTADEHHGQEMLNNCIRLGSAHGDPRYVQRKGDGWFIFQEHQPEETLKIDLGRDAVIVRVGVYGFDDMWIHDFNVATGVDNETWTNFGSQTSGSEGGQIFVDRGDAAAGGVRVVRIQTKSRHYRGCGCRIGPIFIYGWYTDELPEEARTLLDG